MTLSAEAYRELRELRDLVSHIIPHGELDKVMAHGIRLAVKQARKAKWKIKNMAARASEGEPAIAPQAIDETSWSDAEVLKASMGGVISVEEGAPRLDREPSPRLVNKTKREPVPAPMRRDVYVRDGGCCTFTTPSGEACGSTWQVEVDHIKRVADGGATTLENLRLCCRMHNQARETAA